MIRNRLQYFLREACAPKQVQRKITAMLGYLHGRVGSTLTFFSIVILFLAIVLPVSALAIDPVTGRYRSTFGTTIELDLTVGYPPPASIIIEQYFPVGLHVIGAEPALHKFSTTRGVAKWLLKGVSPGTYTISLQFDQLVQSSIAHAIIRYRYPLRGYFVEYRIKP